MTDAMYDLMYVINWVITVVLKMVVICTVLPLTYCLLRRGRNVLYKLRQYNWEDR